MSGASRSGSRWPRFLLVMTILLVGAVTSLVAYLLFAGKERRLVQAQLQVETQQRVRALEQRFRSAIVNVYRVLPPGDKDPDPRAVFRRLAGPRLDENPDLLAFFWIPRVRADRKSEHENAVRQEGLSDYRIRQPDLDVGLELADELPHADAFPITFAEPHERNQGTLGLDLGRLRVFREAMEQAVQTGQPAVTPPIPWSDDSGRQAAIFVFRPLSRDRNPEQTPDQRRRNLIGFGAVAVRAERTMENALGGFLPGIDVVLLDGASPPDRRLVYDSQAGRARLVAAVPPRPQGGAASTPPAELDLPGRRWEIRCAPTAAYLAGRHGPLPVVVLIFGLLLTILVGAYSNTLLGRKQNVERLVVRRTRQLKKVNEKLAYERFLLDTLLRYSPDYIYFKDTQSRFIRVSHAVARYLGFGDPSKAVGKTDFDAFDADRARQYLADEQRIMESGEPEIDKEEEQVWPDGQHVYISTTKVPLRSDEGKIVGTFGISRDITARKSAEAQLAEAKEAAEAASRAKSDFLANMSHEIRTPMNAVMGMTELVLESISDDSQREYLKMVLESSEWLMSIINDILDFSKIEAGKLKLERSPFDLRELLGDTMRSLGFRAHGKGLELACHVGPGVPQRLLGDHGRLRQVIVNLVGNAVKFTDAGEVVLDVACPSPGDDPVLLHFAVRDTGVGIPEDKKALIFDAFEQADRSSTRRFGGTGLGLAICSRLVEMMGGRIWAESNADRGSTFHFTASFQVIGPEQAAPPHPGFTGTPVLIVDDSATNRQILEEMLSDWGMLPQVASGAATAVEMLREAYRAGRAFPLVLTDANMPEMDGFALAEAIKQDSQLGSTVIMMLTSGDRSGDVARCERLGIAAYLLKPIKQSELFDAVALALGISEAEDTTAAVSASREIDLPPKKILLAEDSLVNQKLAVGLLQRHGHTVVVANHGREALAALESQHFDLVLMDVQMPEMDGLEATAVIRAKEKTTSQRIPIIAMTAHAMKGDRQWCLAAGMDDYVAKPIRARRLLETIRRVLAPEDGQQRGPPQTLSPPGDPLNWSEAMRSVDGDRGLLEEITRTFLNEYPQLLDDARRAIADGEAGQLALAAHKLKGALRYFGAENAFRRTLAIEQDAQRDDLEHAGQMLHALAASVQKLAAALEARLRDQAGGDAP